MTIVINNHVPAAQLFIRQLELLLIRNLGQEKWSIMVLYLIKEIAGSVRWTSL